MPNVTLDRSIGVYKVSICFYWYFAGAYDDFEGGGEILANIQPLPPPPNSANQCLHFPPKGQKVKEVEESKSIPLFLINTLLKSDPKKKNYGSKFGKKGSVSSPSPDTPDLSYCPIILVQLSLYTHSIKMDNSYWT